MQTRGFKLVMRTFATAALALAGAGAGAQGPAVQHEMAMQAYELGLFSRSAELLFEPAAAGHLRSLEVLGLMHWYGTTLYGAGRWDKTQGQQLLQQAAADGSEVALVVLRRPRRLAAAQQ